MNRFVSHFLGDRRGNFAMMSAFAAVPLVMAAGIALDAASIARKKSQLQQATDIAALAITREGKNVSTTEAYLIAKRFLDSTLTVPYTNLKVVRNGTEFTVQAETDGGTHFSSLFGHRKWPVTATSTADIAYSSYEVALVLDTTGSMAGGKLASMKDAVIGLIDNMSKQIEDQEKLKFAMVPFATFVNVGPNFGPDFKKGKQVPGTGAQWLDLKGLTTLPQVELSKGASRFQVYKNLRQNWPGCVETRYSDGSRLDVDDTPPNPSRPETLFVPVLAIDEPDAGYANSFITSDAKPGDGSVVQKKKRWAKYGVETDAAGDPLNGGVITKVTGTLTDPLTGEPYVPVNASAEELSSKKKGPGRGCTMQPITPLSNDYKKLKKQVEQLEANGTTNITEGVAWGTRVLSPGLPFAEGKDRKTNGIEKIMIVLTDGSNVFGNNGTALGSSYSSNGYLVDGRLGISGGGSSATNERMNLRTLAACEIAKAAGTEVYTIRLEEPNVQTGDMLKNCATDADHYFDVPSRTQLDAAFEKIREKIVRVRLSS